MKTFADLSVSHVFKSNLNSRKCWSSHNIISRTEKSIKFSENVIKDSDKSQLKPISDFPIIKNLNIFQFPHPQLLISFLSMHRQSSNAKIKDILYPYLLIPDFSINNIIYAIASSLSLTSERLLQNFTSNLDCQKAKEEWKKRFNEIPIDTNLKITEKWSLNSLNDLGSLHLLACSLDCKIYLLFNLISPTNNDENTLFTTVVGPTYESTNCIFFLCETPTKIIYVKPMNYIKKRNYLFHNLPLLKRVTLPSKKCAIYLNFSQLLKEIFTKGSSFDSISAHFIIDPTISEPILSFPDSNHLQIEIRHPNDDYSYCELLEKLEHITSSFSTTEPAIIDDHSIITFNCNQNQNIKIHSNSLITVHSIKESKIELSKIHEIDKLSQIEKLAWSFCSLNFPPLTKSSDFKLFQLIRFLTPFITNYKSFQSQEISLSPIIATHTNDFSLSEASNHPFAHFLCMHSIFNAAANSRTIACKKCHRSRATEEASELVLIPVRTVSNKCLVSPFLSWICIDCFCKQTNREKLAIKGQFPFFHDVVHADNESSSRVQSSKNMLLELQANTERIHLSVMSIRSQPIGALRALVPRIDSAFSELLQVMKLFRQRLIRMADVTAEDLATVRDSDEYRARIGDAQRALKVPEPDVEAVDYEFFRRYLAGFTEKAAGVTEYLLTQPESSIRQDLMEEVEQGMQDLYTTISSTVESIEIKYSPGSKASESNNNNNSIGNNNRNNDNNRNDNNKRSDNNDRNDDNNRNDDNDKNDNNDRNDNNMLKENGINNTRSEDDGVFNDELEHGNLFFNVCVKCASPSSDSPPPLLKNVYRVHLIEGGNSITSAPLVTLKTRKLLSGVSLYKRSELLLVANDTTSLTTELYVVPLADCDLDILSTDTASSPQLVIPNVSRCEASFSPDGSSVAILGVGADENPLFIATSSEETGRWKSEDVASIPATKVTWLSNAENVIVAASDECYYVLRFGMGDEEEESAPIIDMPKHKGRLVALTSAFNAVWAIFDSGECIQLQLEGQTEEEEEEFEEEDTNTNDKSTNDKSTNDKSTNDKSTNDKSTNDKSTNDKSTNDKSTNDKNANDKSTNDKSTNDKNTNDKSTNDNSANKNDIFGNNNDIDSDDDGDCADGRIKFNLDCKVVDGYLSSENGEIGVTVVCEDGKLHFKKPLVQSAPPLVEIQPSLGHRSYNFPSGLFFSNESEIGHFTSSQIALSFVEMFPVLVGYFYRSSFFLVHANKSEVKSYHPQNKNRFLASSIRSFYVNEMIHISLHHVEDSLFQMKNLKAKVVTFIDLGLRNGASFVDSIFGTSFAFCESDGVWISMKTVGTLVYIVVYFKALSFKAKNQVLLDAAIASFLYQKKIFFLTESEVPLFDILNNINIYDVLHSSNYHAYALLFMRNSNQKEFECKTIEVSLNNSIQNATIKVFAYELFEDYSEILMNKYDGNESSEEDSCLNQKVSEFIRSTWNDILDKIDYIDIDYSIDSIKKMISLMSTFYQFQDIDPLSVISNCF